MSVPVRVGIGHDTHRLIPGDGLHLGGVFVPHDRTLLGHSDADVLLHAIIDALLGAAALGDIGEMFPDTEEENRGRSSLEMLRLAWKRIQISCPGWKIQNLDCILFAQRPKLAGYKTDMVLCIAEALGITPQQVNIKAKTGEGVGLIGEEIVMEAQCVVLLSSAQAQADSKTRTLAAARPTSAPQVTPAVTPSLTGTKAVQNLTINN